MFIDSKVKAVYKKSCSFDTPMSEIISDMEKLTSEQLMELSCLQKIRAAKLSAKAAKLELRHSKLMYLVNKANKFVGFENDPNFTPNIEQPVQIGVPDDAFDETDVTPEFADADKECDTIVEQIASEN